LSPNDFRRLVDELTLVGPAGRVAEQLVSWRSCPISTLIVEPTRAEGIEQIADIRASA
jgi:hypothetical protein